jgi:hypothetical protein
MSPNAKPAGWYPDPWDGGHRWWDGKVWTDHTSAQATPPSRPPGRSGDWAGAILIPFFLAPVGLIAGLVYVIRGGEKRPIGLVCLALSTLMCLAWVALGSA